MLKKIWRRLKKINEAKKALTRYHWKSVQAGIFSGQILYLPMEWEEEVTQGRHEREFIKIIQAKAASGGVFYDIGAHYGWFTALWLQCGGQYVEAFEPLAENQAIFNQMTEKNRLEGQVRLHNVAIGRHTGSDWLVAYPGDTSRTFVAQSEEIHSVGDDAQRRLISIWTLSGYVREKKLKSPDLIKIDVEGLEGDVIEGAQEFFTEKKPAVMAEIHSSLNGLRAADQMKNLGYQMQILGMKGKRKSLPLVLWTHPANSRISS